MIRRTVRIRTSRDGLEKVLDILASIVEPVRAGTRCLGCRVCQDVSEPNEITYVEEWECQEALDSHMRSAEHRRLLNAMEFSEGEPEVTCEEVTRSTLSCLMPPESPTDTKGKSV